VKALPASRFLALEIAWFASPQPGGMQARIEALETGYLGSSRSGGVRARLEALEHALGMSSPELGAAPPTPANGLPLDPASLSGSQLRVTLFPQSPSSASGKSPAVPSMDDKDTNPKPYARSGCSPSPSALGGDSSMLCVSPAKHSIARTEVPPSVPPKDDPAVPSTDDKDTNPKPYARSGSFPSPSAPGGDSSMF
jgi:hypothetical protein